MLRRFGTPGAGRQGAGAERPAGERVPVPVSVPIPRFGPHDVPADHGRDAPPSLTDDPGGPLGRAGHRFVRSWGRDTSLAGALPPLLRMARPALRPRHLDRAVGRIALLRARRSRSLFPDARFVHIHRDGRDTAMSMQRTPHLPPVCANVASNRSSASASTRSSPANWPGTSPWMPWFTLACASGSFPQSAFRSAKNGPFHLFGWLWSNMIERGTSAPGRPSGRRPRAHRCGTSRFSSLRREEMSRFIDFVGPQFRRFAKWLDRICELPRKEAAELVAPGRRKLHDPPGRGVRSGAADPGLRQRDDRDRCARSDRMTRADPKSPVLAAGAPYAPSKPMKRVEPRPRSWLSALESEAIEIIREGIAGRRAPHHALLDRQGLVACCCTWRARRSGPRRLQCRFCTSTPPGSSAR